MIITIRFAVYVVLLGIDIGPQKAELHSDGRRGPTAAARDEAKFRCTKKHSVGMVSETQANLLPTSAYVFEVAGNLRGRQRGVLQPTSRPLRPLTRSENTARAKKRTAHYCCASTRVTAASA